MCVSAWRMCERLGSEFVFITTGIQYLSEYGWHVLLVLVCVGVLWVKVGPAVREWWTKRKEREEELNFGE